MRFGLHQRHVIGAESVQRRTPSELGLVKVTFRGNFHSDFHHHSMKNRNLEIQTARRLQTSTLVK